MSVRAKSSIFCRVTTVTLCGVSRNASDGTTEGTGSYTTGATATATRLPLTLRETPQSVTVVTRQKMDCLLYTSRCV